MQCEVRSMSDDNDQEDDNSRTINSGVVGQVCREWLVREDEVVAHRLQDEEFQHHYGNNRSRNQMVRQDTQKARTIQTEEELTAAEVQQQVELMYLKQQEEDAKVAFQVQELLSQQEVEKQRHLQEADEQYARHLQEKEKERLQKKKREKGLMREQKEVQRALAHHSSNDDDISEGATHNDYSDLCVQPTPDMSECQTKKLQEQQDEELARLLQEQESKRGAPSAVDQKLAVETQDREIAKYLQEQERAKARKAKERARLKALQRQQEANQDALFSPDDDAVSNITVESSSSSSRNKSYSSRNEKQALQTPSKDGSQVSNIAMAIDPTYNRKMPDNTQMTSPTHSIPVTPRVHPIPTRAAHSERPSFQTEIRNVSMDNECRSHEDLDDDDDPVPPYMPIQGQRRSGSLEKHAGKKGKKDGCKNQ